MVGWHHWLDGLEFEQPPGDGEEETSLVCCSPWGVRVGHNWATENNKFSCREWNQTIATRLLPDMGHFSYYSSWAPFMLRFSHLEGQNSWWLWHPCLLIQQEIPYFTTLTHALSCLKVKSLHFSKDLVNPDSKHTERHVWILHGHQGKGWAIINAEQSLEINTT